MDADVAAELRALALRVRHNVPDRHDPERFHVEKSEIERKLGSIAARYEDNPRRGRERHRDIVRTEIRINGRRIG
jgi:hypothetical protein